MCPYICPYRLALPQTRQISLYRGKKKPGKKKGGGNLVGRTAKAREARTREALVARLCSHKTAGSSTGACLFSENFSGRLVLVP